MKIRKNSAEHQRKAIQTTGLRFELKDSNKIVLYKTGHKNAGENLEKILKLRSDPDIPLRRGDA